MTSKQARELIEDKLSKYFSACLETATKEQAFKASALVVRDILLNKKQYKNKVIADRGLKKVYYLCMEFLLGRSLKNNLSNLGIETQFAEAFGEAGIELSELYELEADPGLGNGGLGRLAACFFDSLATLEYPATGFSLRYEYGLFKQKIVDNTQVELPDVWLDTGDIWLMPRSDKNFQVKYGGHIEQEWTDGKLEVRHVGANIVEAIPYDMLISGAEADGAGVLRLWRAANTRNFDMLSFSQGDYAEAMRADNNAELITKVLYPSDEHYQGKQLRITQQYFLVSASLQNIVKEHFQRYKTLDNIADKAAIHINDTHPALAVPEMMRILIDEYGYSWDSAWFLTHHTISYTNHTVLSEALEKWDIQLIKMLLPRIYTIVDEINRRFEQDLRNSGQSELLPASLILWNRQMRMANLCVIGSHSVNGVSQLHSDIIKKSIFKEFYRLYPERFTNVTNGIAHRRWLFQANPRLASLITELIGDGCYKDAGKLSDLLRYSEDNSVLSRLDKIKLDNKISFSDYISGLSGQIVDPHTRFDVHIKRLHEYKRQLMNVLKIIGIYLRLLDDPGADITPQTFIFGAKAAGSYYHAKRVIMLINCLSDEIGKASPAIREKLNVIFVENYNVSKAEKLIPAAEISEQISLAGKEASGTSNMKFMMLGALTLGTIDGANVEILAEVGHENMFAFGMTADEVEAQWAQGYNATSVYSHNEELRQILDKLRNGVGGENFSDIAQYLTIGSGNIADPYMCLLDYDSYTEAAARADAAYADKHLWNRMSLTNIAKSGTFSADRSIREYAEKIWNISSIK